MADKPIRHKPFSGHEILLRGNRPPFFEGPEETAEWPGDFDPLLERGIRKERDDLFCTSGSMRERGWQELIGLETQLDGLYIFKLTRIGLIPIRPHL